MKLLVINNLASGNQDGSIYDYLRLLASDGDCFIMRSTDGTTPIESFLSDAHNFDVVVVSGGDGTQAAVSHFLAQSGIPILPFPAGTGNLLATNLLLPLEPHALALMTKEMNTLEFDLGLIESDGQIFGFNIMAGAGFDATIMTEAQAFKKSLGAFAYFQAALSNATPQYSSITLTVDGKTFEREGLGVLLVNFSKIQFDIPLTPGSNPRDGQFEVVVLKAENAFGLIPAIIAGILDRDGEHPNRSDSVELFHGSSVSVEADPPFALQYDGETPQAMTPFKAHILPKATKFIVSNEYLKQVKKTDQE